MLSCPLWEDYSLVIAEERSRLLNKEASVSSSHAYDTMVSHYAATYLKAADAMPGAARPVASFGALLNAVQSEIESEEGACGGVVQCRQPQRVSLDALLAEQLRRDASRRTMSNPLSIPIDKTCFAAQSASLPPALTSGRRGVISSLLGVVHSGSTTPAAPVVSQARVAAESSPLTVVTPDRERDWPVVKSGDRSEARDQPWHVRQLSNHGQQQQQRSGTSTPRPGMPVSSQQASAPSNRRSPVASPLARQLSSKVDDGAMLPAKGASKGGGKRSAGRATRRSASQRSETSGTDLYASFSQNPQNNRSMSNAGGSSRGPANGVAAGASPRADPLADIKATQRSSWRPATAEPGFVALEGGVSGGESFADLNAIPADNSPMPENASFNRSPPSPEALDPLARYLDEQAMHLDAEVIARHMAMLREEQSQKRSSHPAKPSGEKSRQLHN